MEYTKDIVLDIRYKRGIGIMKLKLLANKVKKIVCNNKMIVITLTLLSTLIVIDFALINSFLQILSNIN